MTETGSPSNAQFAMSIKWEPISAISPPEYSRYIRQLIRRSYFASATGLRQLLWVVTRDCTSKTLPKAPLPTISMAT